MEFRPTNNDVNDALKLRILTDDMFILKCLEEVGLKTEGLSNSAKRMIIDDFRKVSYPMIKLPNYDSTDTFSRFVNADGNYQRKSKWLWRTCTCAR